MMAITTRSSTSVNAFRGKGFHRSAEMNVVFIKGSNLIGVPISRFHAPAYSSNTRSTAPSPPIYNAPVVSEIDLSGYTGGSNQPIRIVATDGFDVASVGVRITNTSNAVVEEGPATRSGQNGSDWTYQSRTALPPGETVSIEVTATDRPGNKAVKTRPKS